MDYFVWRPSLERESKLRTQSEYWQKKKSRLSLSFSLSDADKDSLLDFFTSHVESPFVYFMRDKSESHSVVSSVYATETDVVLVDNLENFRCQLWLNAIVDEVFVDSGLDSYTIDYSLPDRGFLRVALNYTGEGDYLEVLFINNATLKVFVENNYLIGTYKEEDEACYVEIPIGNIWQSPNIVMGHVISFSLSWNSSGDVYLGHNGQTQKFQFGQTLGGSQITTLSDVYDIIICDIFLLNLLKFFDYKFEDFTTIIVDNYTINVDDYTFYTKTRIGFPCSFQTNYISFRGSGTQFLTENVLIQEI